MQRLKRSIASWLVAVGAMGTMFSAQLAAAQECPSGTVESDVAMASLLPALDQAIAVGNADPCHSLFDPPPDAATQQIAKVGGPGARVTTIPIVYQSEQGAVRIPLYRVASPSGFVRYVEPGGRTYQSFAAWQKQNQLPPGQVTFPADGNIAGPGCDSQLATNNTPASSVGSKIVRGLDIAAGVAGVGIAVAVTVGTGGTALVVGGLAVAAYTGVRSVFRLTDKVSHQESINPLKNTQARNDELSLALTVVGLSAAGSAIGGANNLARGLNVASVGLGVASLGDQGYQTAVNWKQMSTVQRATAVSALMFSAAMTAVSVKQLLAPKPELATTAAKKPEEAPARNPTEEGEPEAVSRRTTARAPAQEGGDLPVEQTPSSLREPATTRKVTWTQPKDETPLFVNGKPSPEDVRQGPLGDCYNLAPLADAAATDPALLKQHIIQVGEAPNGDKIYGAVFYVPSTQAKTIARFERAAPDVIDPDSGKSYTPVWTLVTDRQPIASDGTLISAATEIPDKGNVGWATLSEKALALKHGDKSGYRTITNGGYADKVMEELSGRESEKFDLTRAVKVDADLKLADDQFAKIQAASDQGKMVAMGSWDTAAVRRRLARLPQLDPSGQPDTYFDPKKFDFADGAGNAASTGTAAVTADDSRLGAGWVGNHEYSMLKAWVENGVKMVELRNPWGDVRPPEFSDGTGVENGIIKIPWYRARILFGDVAIGGRASTDRTPLQITQMPTLPAGVKPVPIVANR